MLLANRSEPHLGHAPEGRSRIGFDVADGVFHRKYLFGCVIGNLASNFLFEGHDEFDGITDVCATIIATASISRNLGLIAASMFAYYLVHAFVYTPHFFSLPRIMVPGERLSPSQFS